MPRGSPLQRPSRVEFARRGDGTAAFAIQSPQRHLAHFGSAALQHVGDWRAPERKGHEWQRDAFTYNELIGEIGYLHALTANLVSSADLRTVKTTIGEDGRRIAAEATDPRVNRVMDAFVGPQGGQKELKRRAALHYQIAGESYLLGTPLMDEHKVSQGISWEFLSTEEIKVDSQGSRQRIQRNASGTSDDKGFVDVDAYIARFWRPDPRFSMRADSPMKRVLPICRELVVLSEVVDAVAKSRLPAGILVVPEELSFGPLNENEEESADTDDIDRFIQALIEHMRAPVEDRTSAAGLVPLVVKGAAEFLGEIRLISLAQDLDETYQDLRVELLKRIAQGLDAPPEIIGGKAGLNHWTSYNVDADFISKHVNPVGEAIAEFVTTAYLRPMLVEYEGMTEDEAATFSVVFDSRMLTARSDEGPAATGAWDRLTLSDMAYLRANGFSEEDAPTEEERQRRLLEKLVLADPVTYGPMVLPKLYPDLADVFCTPSCDVPEVEGEGGNLATPPAPVGGGGAELPPENQPPEPPTGVAPIGASLNGMEIDPGLVDRLTTAADAALDRALERAANRVLSRMNGKHPVLRDAFKGVPKRDVLSRMTDLDFRSLHITKDEVIVDAWDGLEMRGRAWVRDAFVQQGESSFIADEIASATMTDLAKRLDEFLAETIGAKIPVLASGLRVPTELVTGSLESALVRFGPLRV